VNLYPFAATVARGCTLEEAIEQIDIGGPTLIRASAKNYRSVTVLVDPSDYGVVLSEMKARGTVSFETNQRLAEKAFAHVTRYDQEISNYFSSLSEEGEREDFGRSFSFQWTKIQDLRYGENPHQRGSFYADPEIRGPSIARAVQIQGKELSFNNIMDAEAALSLSLEFEGIATVVIKHMNPCGVATSSVSLVDAFRKAKASDPISIFGGVVAFTRPVDVETANELKSVFLEIVVAPAFSEEALAVMSSSKSLKNVRLLKVDPDEKRTATSFDVRRVYGGILIQDWDQGQVDLRECRVVTKRKPTREEVEGLGFAWKVCKHVKSNAIVFSTADQVIGVGAGQMNRVDSAKIAASRALELGLSLKGTVAASDAFFPFRDGLDEIARHGATAVVQPGGSIRDSEVIEAADEHGMAMIFTGMRHFRH
jgi:phosphoribosylaminoimidazolecarboxamide formyltransferase/IMP cyclohydrolase